MVYKKTEKDRNVHEEGLNV